MGGRRIVSDDDDNEEELDERGPLDMDAVEDGDGDGDEEDYEEEGQDEFENDGFVVDDVEEEEDDNRASSDEEEKRKKKKKKRRRQKEAEKTYEIDDDDWELLEENNPSFRRSNKLKRLKKAVRDTDDGLDENTGISAEENITNSLFDPEVDVGAPPPEDNSEEADSDDSGFIDDDENVHTGRNNRNKKKGRQAHEFSSMAMQEAHEIFGDVDQYLEIRKEILGMSTAGHSQPSGENTIEDEFEPFILAEKYMTEKDEKIRDVDVPERLQVSYESTGYAPTDQMLIEDECTWIINQLNANGSLLGDTTFGESIDEEQTARLQKAKEDVMKLLELMHVQKFDIPFIAMYRKEACSTLLKEPEKHVTGAGEVKGKEEACKMKWHKVLWDIKDLDGKWLLLQKRKKALQAHYFEHYNEISKEISQETRLNLNQMLYQSIVESLKSAELEREVDDVDAKFNLHFPPGEVKAQEGKFRRPNRKTHYSICSKAGLWEVASKIGSSSELFGLHLTLEKMRLDELEDAKETPEEVASKFTCAMFGDSQAVLKGARHMAAVELSCEPRVRKHVRNIFMEKAVISTSPTADGNVAIDSFRQFADIKWVSQKPLTKFQDAQWLLIQEAEEKKLIQVTLKLPESDLNKLLVECSENYLSLGVSKTAKLWNEQRKMILDDMFKHILPLMEKEARSVLSARARRWVLVKYGKHLWDKVSVAPYQRKEADVIPDDDTVPKVLACCWGPGKPATTFVMLDSSGEVLDVLYAGSLGIRSQSADAQQWKKNDQQRVLKFITDHQPHVVVLGAVTLSCAKLKEDIFEIIFKMVEEYPREISQEIGELNVVYGDESLPRLYENSRISSDQLPNQPGIVRRAVALGRYLQNPLAMVATLCGPGKEILSWKLDSLDYFLTPVEKYDMVEQVMVDVMNQVGIDINLAASHEWLFSPLQFVSGLGPRKAASLQRELVRHGVITTRKELASLLKRKVFHNAAGFVRVIRSGLAANSHHIFDLLDDTRIHPESYELAKMMAKTVYDEYGEHDSDNVDEDELEMAIEYVREKPNLLEALITKRYAKSHNALDKLDTLEDIKNELLHGFRDWRTPYRELDPDEQFYLISCETKDTIAEGKIVQATVRKVYPQRVFCVLESGLTGWVMSEDYSDHGRQTDLTEEVNEGDILICKIKSVQMNRYQVYLSCKESELKRDRYGSSQNHDPYYKPEESSLQREQEKARKEKELAKKHFRPRMIVHPRFQNITADDAIQFLSDKEAGESVVRPSLRGPSFLTLTLKISDGVFAHKDIVEGGKDQKDITSLLRLGKTLKIGDDAFEDLDEVMDRYVDPLVAHLKTMLSYRKFKKGTKAQVDELLRVEKSEYPMRIVYCFGISHEHPGTFILSYIRSTNPHHEYIGLYPKGFKFRKQMFEDIDRLVAYFQKHIDDVQHHSGPSLRSVAAVVPMRSPANVGCFGGSTANRKDGGWRDSSNSDRDRSFTPSLRIDRSNYSSGGGGLESRARPSGLPRPYGGGGGHGRGRGDSANGLGTVNNDRADSSYGSSRWGESGSKEGGNAGRGSFPGAKVQNSPGKEAFPGGWGGGSNGGGGWDSPGGTKGAAAMDTSDHKNGSVANSGWGSW
ncbi:hypothetical protein MKW94_029482 [Papaver nudicaule]|uniref:Transcription elongation factor spt6 n=1 Tax=Papaver nudicaule TaxID=74823 RepID=A0AA42B0Q0_PAPNU|nr:hypothetical protein [Papaver nudicaule]